MATECPTGKRKPSEIQLRKPESGRNRRSQLGAPPLAHGFRREIALVPEIFTQNPSGLGAREIPKHSNQNVSHMVVIGIVGPALANVFQIDGASVFYQIRATTPMPRDTEGGPLDDEKCTVNVRPAPRELFPISHDRQTPQDHIEPPLLWQRTRVSQAGLRDSNLPIFISSPETLVHKRTANSLNAHALLNEE